MYTTLEQKKNFSYLKENFFLLPQFLDDFASLLNGIFFTFISAAFQHFLLSSNHILILSFRPSYGSAFLSLKVLLGEHKELVSSKMF